MGIHESQQQLRFLPEVEMDPDSRELMGYVSSVPGSSRQRLVTMGTRSVFVGVRKNKS